MSNYKLSFLVGNLLSVVVLCQTSMYSFFHKLLAFLCLADFLFIIPNIILSVLLIFNIYESIFYPICECLSHVSLAASIFLTAGITFERYQVGKNH